MPRSMRGFNGLIIVDKELGCNGVAVRALITKKQAILYSQAFSLNLPLPRKQMPFQFWFF